MSAPTYRSAGEWANAYIEEFARTYDAFLPGLGEVLRDLWTSVVRPDWFTHALCDCNPTTHHRWNCPATPVWAQTMRDLDCNPWTVFRLPELALIDAASPHREDPTT